VERKYILLINDEHKGTVCWKGEGTVGQVKNDIEHLVGKKAINPADLEVIPVIGNRGSWVTYTLLGSTVLGLMSLAGVVIYENLRKRVRKGRREHSDS
jgi:hypothetical protein